MLRTTRRGVRLYSSLEIRERGRIIRWYYPVVCFSFALAIGLIGPDGGALRFASERNRRQVSGHDRSSGAALRESRFTEAVKCSTVELGGGSTSSATCPAIRKPTGLGARRSAEDSTCDACLKAMWLSMNRDRFPLVAGGRHVPLCSREEAQSGCGAKETSEVAPEWRKPPAEKAGNTDDHGVRGKRGKIIRVVPGGSGMGGGTLSKCTLPLGEPALHLHHRVTAAGLRASTAERMAPGERPTDIAQGDGVRSPCAAILGAFPNSGSRLRAGEWIGEDMENANGVFAWSAGSTQSADDKGMRSIRHRVHLIPPTGSGTGGGSQS